VDEAVELQARSGRPRLFALDALRGLAAVSVVVHHFHEAFSAGNVRWWSVLFGSGKAAVVLFFVLSGYVLSLPSWEGRQAPYGIYLVRRVCRIYLPFAAAAALSIAGDAVFWRFHPALSGWYALTWQAPVSPALVLVQFTMWPMAVFNTAFWSLFFEMEMSVAMPWVCAALKRVNGVAATLGSYGVVYAATWVLAHRHVDVVGHPAGWNALRTVQILCHFLLGATLARYSGRIGELWRAMAAWQWLALAGVLLEPGGGVSSAGDCGRAAACARGGRFGGSAGSGGDHPVLAASAAAGACAGERGAGVPGARVVQPVPDAQHCAVCRAGSAVWAVAEVGAVWDGDGGQPGAGASVLRGGGGAGDAAG
jgi:peptidoglycan/LPS O-acetylase OafA/YrhL